MKRALLVVGVVLVVASLVYATESRVRAMGENFRFFRDNLEIYQYPAALGDYTNLAIGEFDVYGGENRWAGLNLKLLSKINLGVAVQRVEGKIYEVDEVAGDDITEFRPINGLDLILNLKTERVGLGLGIYTSGNKDYSKVVRSNGTVYSEETKKTGVFGIKLGALVSPVENSVILGNVNIGLNSYKHEAMRNDTTRTYELTGGLDIGVGVKGFLPVNDNVTFVPDIEFSNFSYKQKFTNDKVAQASFELGSISEMALVLGLGLNYKLEKTLIVAGLSFEYTKGTDESDTTEKITGTMMHIPIVNLGVEHEISSRFTGRLGVRKGFGYLSTKREPSSGGSAEISFRGGEDPDLITTGLSAKFGKFVLESSISTNALFTGGYFISGVQVPLNTQLSITYSF